MARRWLMLLVCWMIVAISGLAASNLLGQISEKRKHREMRSELLNIHRAIRPLAPDLLKWIEEVHWLCEAPHIGWLEVEEKLTILAARLQLSDVQFFVDGKPVSVQCDLDCYKLPVKAVAIGKLHDVLTWLAVMEQHYPCLAIQIIEGKPQKEAGPRIRQYSSGKDEMGGALGSIDRPFSELTVRLEIQGFFLARTK